ncbi:MAG: DNA alkylation repair protein [Calditrichaceae bacterium]
MNILIDKVITSLKRYTDPKRVESNKIIAPTKMKVIGVNTLNLRIVVNELKLDTKKFTGREKINLAKELVNTGIFECQLMAFEYVRRDKKARAELTASDIDAFTKNLDNWGSVDSFSLYLSGYAWREGIISTDKIKSYWESDDFWIRRVALVSTVTLNLKSQGGTGDISRTMDICKLAVDDHHDMINKALSWALREVSKRDKNSVEDFLSIFILYDRNFRSDKSNHK